MTAKYRKVEEWKRSGRDFMVTVKHHAVPMLEEPACYDSEGPHRWAVYAYIYPAHPLFPRFDGTENMWQEAAASLPVHGGPSLLRIHRKEPEQTICSYQVGADYHHDGDWAYTQMSNEQESFGVFSDADDLFNHLAQMEANQ